MPRHLQAIDALPDIPQNNLPGVYLDVTSRAGEPLKRASLGASGLTLLRYEDEARTGTNQESATVFASAGGLMKLRKKVDEFATQNTPDRVGRDGKHIPGRPKNADLVQSVAAITESALRSLWRSPPERFPEDGAAASWELWLAPEEADHFVREAAGYGVTVAADWLHFPEDAVVIAEATRDALALATRRLGGVRALAAPTTTADFFDSQDVEEQAEWVANLAARTEFTLLPDPGYVTLLDTGVSRAHPLIQPALSANDRHAANPAWSTEDLKGHGTALAGLALYGDLTSALQQAAPIEIRHRLESAKLIPDVGANPYHLYGAVTRNAVDTVEQTHPRRRTFTMAVTTDQDTPHDGAPTSWSSEMDQLATGVSGLQNVKRLMLISAGNTDNTQFDGDDYLATCDHEDSELESPAQAWNSISVGAFTEKTALPAGLPGKPLAPMGDLSPSSRTASWSAQWPVKPDVVLEGGNWLLESVPPQMNHGWLMLLSTHHNYPQRSFCFSHDTSAATALAAKGITQLWSDYPALWPETVRGLYVFSARWTPQMQKHLPANPNKGDFAPLFKRYGFGVPDLMRARRSASNALVLIVEDTIVPYRISENTGSPIHNEMKLFTLPWPVEELRRLDNADVTLRVALSTFIAPNPSEPSRGSKFGYASHNLRFKLNRADESIDQFMARISDAAEKLDGPESEEKDGWRFGPNRRDVGSLHIDQLTCKASDLARRNLIAVHPVTGWWKSKAVLKEELPAARYALIVEIDAEEIEAELYAEIQAAVETQVQVDNVITV